MPLPVPPEWRGREAERPRPATQARQPRRRVLACVDSSHQSRKAIAHGIALANALGADVTLMRVVESRSGSAALPDPVEWDLLRQEACAHVEGLVKERAADVACLEAHVAEGQAADQICQWARENRAELTVLCSHGEGEAGAWEMGSTARRIIERAPGSILLVPASVESRRHVRHRRLLVPLDGSSRAESALPLAMRIAAAQDAEILLVHAVPEPELTETGPPEPEDVRLRESVLDRNRRVACHYLDRMRERAASAGAAARALVLEGGDARHLLARAIADQDADLVVMAAHGRSGHSDVAAGSVALYLLAHAHVPLLVVRGNSHASSRRDVAAHGPSVRLPGLFVS